MRAPALVLDAGGIGARPAQMVAIFAETVRELEAPQEPPESPETVEEEPQRAEPQPDAPGAQEPVQSPWWRRVFGR
jgi:hypothetical protein